MRANTAMSNRSLRFLVGSCLVVVAASLRADEVAPFRTDDNPDKSLKWYEIVEGKFPPPHSAHAISGELIQCDHPERRFHIRGDRDDRQHRGNYDVPLECTLLPYGSIYYHGAPAALQDIPLGTHLHGLFYVKDPSDKSPPPPERTRAADWEFKRCLRLEDDFSFRVRRKQAWRIDEVDLAAKKLTCTLVDVGQAGGGKPVGSPKTFDLLSGTRVHVGQGFGSLESIAVGQVVQFNITWATLHGPGRVLEIWLDEASRALAGSLQLAKHRDHVRDRGLPGWIEAVDNEKQIVTITFFDGVDQKLFEELRSIDEKPLGRAFTAPEDDPKAPKGGIAVARECLMMYDPYQDRKGGNILAIEEVPAEVGSSGVQIKVKCCMMLEGFRPGHVVRFFPATWPVKELPKEELFFGRE